MREDNETMCAMQSRLYDWKDQGSNPEPLDP